jgi:hypothetical protein
MRFFLLIMMSILFVKCAGWDKCYENGKEVKCENTHTYIYPNRK